MISSDMPDKYWNKQQFWRINTNIHLVAKSTSVYQRNIILSVNAFVDLIKEYGQDDYDFSLRETQTYEIIDDVAKMRSELGILFLNEFNEVVFNQNPEIA